MKLTKTIARSLKLFCSLLSCLAFMTAGAETLKFDFSAILQPLSPNFALPLLGGGNGLSLVLERNTIRPGERWSEAYLEIKENLPPDAVELRAFIYDSQKDGHLVAEKMVIPSGLSARLSVDLRTLGLSAARLRVELAVNKVLQDAVETFLYAAPPQKILTPGERVKILLSPATTNLDALQPVTFGFPLPPGSLWAPQALRLVDNCGQEIPFQFETTALWAPDGSIKWGRFDSVVNVSSGCWVEVNQAEGLLPDQPVETKKTARGIKITIGQT
ncbi:MAG: hypothetical protein GX811_12085, partial [Lentisphaerae bacterium]|nr:hypothetical protein [Lentisphaerota bacterium]